MFLRLDLTVCFAPYWSLILPMSYIFAPYNTISAPYLIIFPPWLHFFLIHFLICWKWMTFFTQKQIITKILLMVCPLTIPFISLQLCVNLLQYGIFISILKFKQSKYFEWLLTFYKTNVFYCFSRYNNHGRQTFKSIKLLSFPLQSEMRVTILFVLFKKLAIQSLTRNTML